MTGREAEAGVSALAAPGLTDLLAELIRLGMAATTGAACLWLFDQWRRRRAERRAADRCADCGRVLIYLPDSGLYRPHVCAPRY